MAPWVEVVLLTLMAGMAMPLGALLASVEQIRPNWLNEETRHGVIAFGGGALLSAVALVLVPEGCDELSIPLVAVCFLTGGIAFMALDIFLASHQSPMGQLAAMLSDFIPEAIALGAAFAAGGSSGGMLLAGLMALQNIPEGFNAYREMVHQGHQRSKVVIGAFAAMALLGPVAGLCGLWVLSGHPQIVAAMMLIAAGGILYVVFQDIAPAVPMQRKWLAPLGAVLGFLLGMIGQMLVH